MINEAILNAGEPVHGELVRTTAGASAVNIYRQGTSRAIGANEVLVVDSVLISTDTRQTIWLFDDRDGDNAISAGIYGERIAGGVSVPQDGIVAFVCRHVCAAGTAPKLYTSAAVHNTSVVIQGRIIPA